VTLASGNKKVFILFEIVFEYLISIWFWRFGWNDCDEWNL